MEYSSLQQSLHIAKIQNRVLHEATRISFAIYTGQVLKSRLLKS